MIQNYKNYYIRLITLVCCLFIISCSKKGDRELFIPLTPVTFINNLGGLAYDVYYDGDLIDTGIMSTATFRVRSDATGKFTFKDSKTDTILLENEIEISNKLDTIYLFRMDETARPTALRYIKGAEPAPRQGYVKVKIANAAKMTTGGKVDIIFSQLDYNTFTFVPVDTLLGITKDFPATYVELKHGYLPPPDDIYPVAGYSLEIRNSNTGEVIKSRDGQPFFVSWDATNPMTGGLGKVFTIYLSERKQAECYDSYVNVNETCYTLEMTGLFFE